MPTTGIPTEVELAFELMPCQAERVAQEPGFTPHACAYFRKWGTYHSFDYVEAGPPKAGTQSATQYVGRAPLVPEMLSGCRKAPILAVGINPNLPGWWANLHASLNPLFDDLRQYAHYFRFRRTAKPELNQQDYTAFGGGPADEPPNSHVTLAVPAGPGGAHTITVHWREQKMYAEYQRLLDDLAAGMHWPANKLVVGEDLAYANMVACPSAKWTTRPDPSDPRLPPMTDAQRDGIVTECFRHRKYFLRQLFQSLPTVILVFSQNTAAAFIGELHGRFSKGDPQPDDSVAALMGKEVLLHFGDLPNGAPIEARVLFAPHPTGNPAEYAQARGKLLQQLLQTVQQGRLALHGDHLARPKGACVFCPMLDIGVCDYAAELQPLASPPQIAAAGVMPVRAEKGVQAAMLTRFVNDLTPDARGWEESDDYSKGPHDA